MNNRKQIISDVLELTKIKITIFVTITTIFGFICAKNSLNAQAYISALGTLLLACAAAVTNHLQEEKTDALMERTKNRPLPSGRIKRKHAIILAVSLFILGSVTLYFFVGFLPFFLGVLTLVWYNGIYTPLKRKNYAAIIPGSVIGAIPPMIGWVAAGNYIFDPQILLIAFFFFIWQIPHFWLLLLFYRSDYEQAGFPTMFKYLNQSQIARLTYVWTIATGFIGLLFPVFSIAKFSISGWIILACFLWLLYKSSVLLREDLSRASLRFMFKEINLYVSLIVFFVSLDKLLILL